MGEKLILAVQGSSLEEVESLLKHPDVDVNYTDNEDNSVLFYAKKNENDKIVQLVEDKILEDSISILKDYKMLEHLDPKNEQSEDSLEELKQAEEEVFKKIDTILKRLKDQNMSDYKCANIFLHFLETFSFHYGSTSKHDDSLTRRFFCNDSNNEKNEYYLQQMQRLRNLILHDNNKILKTPEMIIKIMECCFQKFDSEYPTDDKKRQLFDKLEENLRSLKINENNVRITTFFYYEDKDVNNIFPSDESDGEQFMSKLKDLIVKAYKNDINEELEQHWFEFNVNIYPYLINVENKKNKNLLEKQMVHLRTHFIHQFDKYGIGEFKELIIKLKGKFLEYLYMQKIHKLLRIKNNELEKNINKDFERIRNEFENTTLCISEQESKNLLFCASKFEKSIFPTLSSKYVDDVSLIKEYFTFMPIIEYINKTINEDNDFNNNHAQGFVTSELLDEWSRREFFEQYVNAKMYKKEKEEDSYMQEKKRLINGLSAYGVTKECIEKLFGEKISDNLSSVIENVNKFIQNLWVINENYIRKDEIHIVEIVEHLLKDQTDLVVLEEFHQIPQDVPQTKIIQECIGKFTTINIAGIEVDIKTTVKAMVKTFYNVFNEYRIEINVRDLFKRQTFLNALFNEENKQLQKCKEKRECKDRLSTLIKKLIQIDYMFPFIVKLVEKFDCNNSKSKYGDCIKSELDDDVIMKNLIQYLTKEKCFEYLSTLLTVKFNNCNPYQLLHDFIVEETNGLERIVEETNGSECIHKIFDEFDHIEGMKNVLQNSDESIEHDYKQKMVIPFLEIINKKAKERFLCTRNYFTSKYRLPRTAYASDEELSKEYETNEEKRKTEYKVARKILSTSKQVAQSFSLAECHKHCIERDLLDSKILNAQEYVTKAIQLLDFVTVKLEKSCIIENHSETHERYKLLTKLIKAHIQKTDIYIKKSNDVTFPCFDDLYNNILKYIKGKNYEETKIEQICETSEEIKNNKNYSEMYKELLRTSDLLDSAKYFNLFIIAQGSAFVTLLREEKDNKKLYTAIIINKIIYSNHLKYFGREHLETVEILRYIAKCYSNLKEDQVTSCLEALTRLNMYYHIRKDNPIIFAEKSIKKNLFYTLQKFVFKYYSKTKDLTDFNNKKELEQKETLLQKVYNLCQKIVEDNNEWFTKDSSLINNYIKVLKILAQTCFDLGDFTNKLSTDYIEFYNKALDYLNQLEKIKEIDAKDREFYHRNSAKLHFKLSKNYKKIGRKREAYDHLRKSIHFNELLNDKKWVKILRDVRKKWSEHRSNSYNRNYQNFYRKSKRR